MALFDALGVPAEKPEIPQVGRRMEELAAKHLEGLRSDLLFRGSRPAMEFRQYYHLAVFKDFTRKYADPGSELADIIVELTQNSSPAIHDALISRLKTVSVAIGENHQLVSDLVNSMPEESLLKLDVAIAAPQPENRLLIGLSSKWSLRTDRAQDCISQGSKLVSLRRGHMPHYAVLTMEPRPAMLRLIAYGSGAVDCVYHLALQELRDAARTLEGRRRRAPWAPRALLERMVAQGRVRDYGELVAEVRRLPTW
ncbi:NgoMIV family type II restriction endonuclease [Nocardia caishijiensis]|nr:NgoMIV family type II restriction endonuclease [Nocardia caishijiensis]